jgi:hypothetical protein
VTVPTTGAAPPGASDRSTAGSVTP